MRYGKWFAGMVLVLAPDGFGGCFRCLRPGGQGGGDRVHRAPQRGGRGIRPGLSANGIEMAINDINAAGGITVKGQKYNFKLAKLDEVLDPTASVNNCRRLRDQYKTPAIFNPLFNSLAAMAKINQEKGNEFLIMAYTSTPKAIEIGNKLLVAAPPPFTVYVKDFFRYRLGKRMAQGGHGGDRRGLRRGMAGRFQGILA